MSAFAEDNKASIENVRPGMEPLLQPGEEIVMRGLAATPVPWWSYLLILGSIRRMMRTNRTHTVVVTNQRVVLAKISGWSTKVTAQNFKVKQEIGIADIRDLVQRGQVIRITTDKGALQLEGVIQLLIFGTDPQFIPAMFAYLKAEVLKLEQRKAATPAIA